MKKISKLIAFVLVLVLGVILVACGNKGGGGDNTATTVNELTAESGVSASGTFEGGSKLKAEAHAADARKDGCDFGNRQAVRQRKGCRF